MAISFIEINGPIASYWWVKCCIRKQDWCTGYGSPVK